MKYYEVNFTIEAPEELMQDARDILSALAGEAGFETFEDTDEGVKGYVQQGLFDEELLKALIGDFPLPSCGVSFTTQEAEDKDWNEQWEQEGFEPIIVDESIVIHDGRHLPEQQLPIAIRLMLTLLLVLARTKPLA
jgi:ribosomal protein L11 methyltransferase